VTRQKQGKTDRGTVTSRKGTETLGDFVKRLAVQSPLSATALAQAAGISRASFYLIRDRGQQPALETLVNLLAALGLRAELPESAESDGPDLIAIQGSETYAIRLDHADRSRVRSQLSARRLAVGAAFATGISGAVGAGPAAVAFAASALAANRRAERTGPQGRGAHTAALRRLTDIAEQMQTDQIEILADIASDLRQLEGGPAVERGAQVAPQR
jgi:transcriptional regulator with XRE-family HTH domain